MQMAVKNFMVAILVCSFTLAQSKECLQSQITFENIKRSDLKEQYEDGEIVKLACSTGYIGSFKMICKNGSWQVSTRRECRKRPCGHPGDAPNADFKLIGDKEFVFGATVEYTCRKGYIMASRENRRNCRAQGWDNSVPVCEVVKCPTIRTSEGIIATGSIEEASFDDVIHFECTSPRKMLDGAESIHCTKDGTWSVSVPNCIDIKCLPPQILFGTIIEPQEEYQENELIKYACDKGYKATPGTPKCTKHGWSIKPECEEVTCVLEFGIPGVHSTSPSGKNIFKPEESLTLTCRKDHWIFGTRLNSQKIKCKDNGEWERSPICNEITCNVPHNENLAFNYFSGDKKLGDRMFYECNYNYRKTASYATCTIDGWSPKTLCTKMTCPEPEIAHAEILRPKDTYTIDDRITIQCFPGYEPVSSFVITCKRQQKWENMKRCTLAKGACGKLTLTNGFIQYSKDHDGAQRASYSCDTGYKAFDEKWWGVVTCQQGVWSHQPQCIRKNECGSLPNVKHGKQIQINEAHQGGQRLKIECDFGYKSRPSSIRCLNGQWETSVCERRRCNTPPEVENAVITSYSTDQELEQLVTFKCKEGLELHGHDTISCINSKWEQTPTCKPFQCPNPDQKIENGVLMTSDHDNKGYWEGDKVEYKCNYGFRFPGENIANCTQREWSYPKCETSPTISLDQDTEIPLNETNQHGDKLLGQENSTVACNGQNQTDSGCEEQTPGCGQHPSILSENIKQHYEEGDTVNYTCPELHTKPPNSLLTCTQGQWTGEECLKLHNITERNESRSINDKVSKNNKNVAAHEEQIAHEEKIV